MKKQKMLYYIKKLMFLQELNVQIMGGGTECSIINEVTTEGKDYEASKGCWVALLLVPMGIDWGLQFIKILKSDNIRRLITGLLGGYGLTHFYHYIILSIIQFVMQLIN